jgi:hypothetical protein
MLFYFVIFCIIGSFIGFILKDFKIAMVVIVAISICWAFVFGPWALATFIELMVGYAVGKIIKKEI